jgi:hypothetical protein
MASAVDTALALTDSAVLPRDRWVRKFDRWPCRAGRHQDHAQRDAGDRVDDPDQHIGHRREDDVVADRCQQQTFGRLEGGAEIRGLQIKRNAEHHEAQDDVQDRQRGRIEVQLDLVDGQHGCLLVVGPRSVPTG